MAEKSDKNGLMKDFLRVNIKTLKLVGLWNSFGLERKTRPAYTTYSWFVATVIFLHVVTQVADLIYIWGDLDNFSATASTLLTYGAALIKQLCYLAKSNQIYRIVHGLRDGKLSPPSKWSEEQKNIAKSHERHARIMSWCYYSLGIGCLFCFAMTAIVSNSIPTHAGTNSTAPSPRKLPYRAAFPFDIEQVGYYGIAFSFQMLVILFGPTVNIGLDAMFVGLVIHACGQFKILENALRNIKRRATIVVDNEQIKKGYSATDEPDRKTSHDNQDEHDRLLENLQQKMSIGLKECLQHHQEILKFITELEAVFNPMMFAQFVSSSGTLCLIIFQITVIDDRGFGMATFVQFLAISIMQLLLFCWYGNELTYQCESMVMAAYESPWYEASEGFKRSIRIMVVRSMKPFRLTGGKLYVMSLDTFVVAVPAPIIRSSKLYTHHRVFVELFLAAIVGELGELKLTHDSGKKQKKLDKYPMLCIQF